MKFGRFLGFGNNSQGKTMTASVDVRLWESFGAISPWRRYWPLFMKFSGARMMPDTPTQEAL